MSYKRSEHRARPFYLIILLLLITLINIACGVPPEDNGGSAGGPEPTQEPAPTEPAATAPSSREPIVPGEKPSLAIDNSGGFGLGGPAVGFVFADGQAPYKAAPVDSLKYVSEDGFTIVAVIDVGEGGQFFGDGHYHVGIDLEAKTDSVFGMIYLPNGTPIRDLAFTRQEVKLNPERSPDTSIRPFLVEDPPPISLGITAESICVVVDRGQGQYFQYCSEPGTALSTRANFEPQYFGSPDGPVQTIETSIGRLAEGDDPYLDDSVRIDAALSIMELEARANIRACAEKGECKADIAGAPAGNFWELYDAAWDQSGGEEFYVPAAVLHVFRPIELENETADVVPPGDYVVWFQFDPKEQFPKGQFIGAELRGLDEGGTPMPDQRIPAVPSTFVPADDSRPEVISQISNWKIVGWCCFWQKKCS